MTSRRRADAFLAIALLAVAGCSAQQRIAGSTTDILRAVRAAREDLYVIAEKHPEVLPDLKRVSDNLMQAVNAAYAIEVDLPNVEDQHEIMDTMKSVAMYAGGAVIVAGVAFVLWRSGFLNAVALLLPGRDRK